MNCGMARFHSSKRLARTIGHPILVLIAVLLTGSGQATAAALKAVIKAGDYHTCALTDAGGVKCWGRNFDGQLGNGSWDDASVPVDVAGLTGDVGAIATGYYHSCALTLAGIVKCWGRNASGALGDGTTSSRNTAVDVGGLVSGVVAITAGNNHTCVLTSAGGVQCWGDNAAGQLGDGTQTTSRTPVDVVGLTSGVALISAGYNHTCAVTVSGGAKCWGLNTDGQLGNNTKTSSSVPVDVATLASGVASITAGSFHTCVKTLSGGAKCWGSNYSGQLGINVDDRLSWSFPIDVVGLTSGVAAIEAGGLHTCALTTGSGVKCWGNNAQGQIGQGVLTRPIIFPLDVSGLTSGVMKIEAGGYHNCAITMFNVAKCWGGNMYGGLGNGSVIDSSLPVNVSGNPAVAKRRSLVPVLMFLLD